MNILLDVDTLASKIGPLAQKLRRLESNPPEWFVASQIASKDTVGHHCPDADFGSIRETYGGSATFLDSGC